MFIFLLCMVHPSFLRLNSREGHNFSVMLLTTLYAQSGSVQHLGRESKKGTNVFMKSVYSSFTLSIPLGIFLIRTNWLCQMLVALILTFMQLLSYHCLLYSKDTVTTQIVTLLIQVQLTQHYKRNEHY